MQTQFGLYISPWTYGQAVKSKQNDTLVGNLKFGEINPAQLNEPDLTLFKTLNRYKKLLSSNLLKAEKQHLLDIMKQPDSGKKSQKMYELIQNKTFPWKKLPRVDAISFENPPKIEGLNAYDDYKIYPKSRCDEERLIFSVQEGIFKKIPFYHFWLYDQNIQLYLGYDFDSLKPGRFQPKVEGPRVFKIKRKNTWYSTNNVELVREASDFMEFLRLISTLRTAELATRQEQVLAPPCYYYNWNKSLEKPVFIPNQKRLSH